MSQVQNRVNFLNFSLGKRGQTGLSSIGEQSVICLFRVKWLYIYHLWVNSLLVILFYF